MNIKLKLTNSQFEALVKVASVLADYDFGDAFEDYLLKAHMQVLAKNLTIKAMEYQKTYKINWEATTALAFAAASEVLNYQPTSFEGNTVDKLTDEINQMITNAKPLQQ